MMMKLSDFDKQILLEAKAERTRLRHLQSELSDYALAKTLGLTESRINHYFENMRKSPMTMANAIDIANLIRIRRCPMAVIKKGTKWQVVEASKLTDSDRDSDGYIGTYIHTINAQQIFNDAR
jgi:DNA-binding transcriptional regulator YdaS (Cro superfamily)